MMLGLESNRVIGPRIAKLMRGGKAARREAQRMVSEKVLAAAKASTSLMAGASGDTIVEQYRRKGGGKRQTAQPETNTAQTKIILIFRLQGSLAPVLRCGVKCRITSSLSKELFRTTAQPLP